MVRTDLGQSNAKRELMNICILTPIETLDRPQLSMTGIAPLAHHSQWVTRAFIS
jgi:hypothetical protein